ncbi:MAG: response regulator [Melioribacteraceae bacterium]|nr:response regulator [Melioribacteraceae bacterium]
MKKILVIEDDLSIRENLNELLTLSEFDVYTAPNGEEGIKMASEVLPALILCDVMMPGKDGYAVKEELYKNEATASIPFIFLSAKSEFREIRKGMILGADDYIIKPYDSKELIESILKRIEKIEFFKKSIVENEKIEKVNSDKLLSDDRILITVDKKPKFIILKTIVFIKANGNYSKVVLEGDNILMVRKLIKNWEEILPESNFIRINQSEIINLDFLQNIERLSNRSFIMKLKNNDNSFIVSQRYTSKIKSKFQV